MTDRLRRERDHFDHVIRTPDEVLELVRRGPTGNDRVMLDAVDARPGRHVVDLGCGGGPSSIWLAQRGARVTGLDLSARSIDVAREVAERLGLADRIEFVVGDVDAIAGRTCDALIGRFALHHLDLTVAGPAIAACLPVGAPAAFVETIDRNPVLRLARRRVVGRFGVRRVGTLDEQPLRRHDIDGLRAAFGELEVVTGEYHFAFMLDRQLFRRRSRAVSRACAAVDRVLARLPVTRDWSYHQVLVPTRR